MNEKDAGRVIVQVVDAHGVLSVVRSAFVEFLLVPCLLLLVTGCPVRLSTDSESPRPLLDKVTATPGSLVVLNCEPFIGDEGSVRDCVWRQHSEGLSISSGTLPCVSEFSAPIVDEKENLEFVLDCTSGAYENVITMISVEPAIGVIAGRVTDASTGRQIEGAVIRIDLDRGSFVQMTSASGSFELGVPRGVPDFVAATVAAEDYILDVINIDTTSLGSIAAHVDVPLWPSSDSVIVVDSTLHHLGDDVFTGAENSRFQLKAEGTVYTVTFDASYEQAHVKAAYLKLFAKGVQEPNPIRLNDLLVDELPLSPGNGTFGFVYSTNIADALVEGQNTLEITAVSGGGGRGERDDFEFAAAYIVPEKSLSAVADTGEDQIVVSGGSIVLGAVGLIDGLPGGAACFWEQKSGPEVIFSNPERCSTTITAPDVDVETVFVFDLAVRGGGLISTDSVSITVLPSSVGSISGIAKDVLTGEPIEGARVVIELERGIVLGVTNANGAYTINVPREIPRYVVISASAEGYVQEVGNFDTTLLADGHEQVDVALWPSSDEIIVIDTGLHHLGDDYYGGSGNTQFQKRTEGLVYETDFWVSPEQGVRTFARLVLFAKGVESPDTVWVNGEYLGDMPLSPIDGSFGTAVSSNIAATIIPGWNKLRIESAQTIEDPTDHDDFEFTAVHISLREM